jgi:ABC-type phosphate transport system auxiliary subunit
MSTQIRGDADGLKFFVGCLIAFPFSIAFWLSLGARFAWHNHRTLALALLAVVTICILAGIKALRYAEGSEKVDPEAESGHEERGVRVGL